MRALSLLLFATFLTGCGFQHPSFYTLSNDGDLPNRAGLGIGVGPVNTADYLNRRNLVIQTGPHKMEVSENNLWAEDLDDSISRVVATNLGRRLNTAKVHSYPWQRDGELDFQISIDIQDFISREDGQAHLKAVWNIYQMPSSKRVSTNTFIGK
jgi:uncharacterized lipoprotein YmbA